MSFFGRKQNQDRLKEVSKQLEGLDERVTLNTYSISKLEERVESIEESLSIGDRSKRVIKKGFKTIGEVSKWTIWITFGLLFIVNILWMSKNFFFGFYYEVIRGISVCLVLEKVFINTVNFFFFEGIIIGSVISMKMNWKKTNRSLMLALFFFCLYVTFSTRVDNRAIG